MGVIVQIFVKFIKDMSFYDKVVNSKNQFKIRGLIFLHTFWLDSHIFAGPVAVSLRRYI